VLLAGGGGGRHIRYAAGTPMTNLYVTLLDRMDVQAGTIGDSKGRLAL